MQEGKLFENLISFSNLLLAFQKAKKAKGEKREILEFEYDLEKNLLQMQADLAEGRYIHGNYRQFVVNDSKRREIKAAPFRDRVLHHAVCNLMEPVFDRSFIFDSFACRKDKGTHSAVKRLKKFLQSVQVFPAKRERERESNFAPKKLGKNLEKYIASNAISENILLPLIIQFSSN